MSPASHSGASEEYAWKAGLVARVRTFKLSEDILQRAESAVYASPDPRVAKKMVRKIIRAERDVLLGKDQAAEAMEAALDLTEKVIDWLATETLIRSSDASVFHQVFERPVFRQPKLEGFGDEYLDVEPLTQDHEVFLVQHDWAGFLEPAALGRAPFRLPADRCCFEFNFSGRRVCGLFSGEDGEPSDTTLLLRMEEGWFQLPPLKALKPGDMGTRLLGLVVDQVRAICITLDAEITETRVIRADHKLNVARAKRGRGPVFDHHVLSLVNRRRYPPQPLGDDREKTRKRLHFRRGHWRHFASFKSWVRWCLVGDPDLGFADKDYRL